MDLSPPTPLDRLWQFALRSAYPLMRLWWFVRRPPHRGALVALSLDGAVLLLRSSYRRGWNFPGGGIRAGETAAQAAQRELMEEIGLAITVEGPATVLEGDWEWRPDTVHVFAVALAASPLLRLDNREVIDARFVAPDALPSMRLTGPVAAYLRGRSLPN